MAKQYAKSPLALARKAAGFTQTEAARRLGFSHKQHLSAIERGQVLASGEAMKAMSVLYRLPAARVLQLAVDAFESGSLMKKHLRRKMKLATLG